MIKLSIILPFYYKLEEFKIALPNNLKFIKSDMELIIPVDEPDSGDSLREYLESINLPCQYKIISNKTPHEWRNPSKAINVGLRNASGEYSIIMSPESILVNDVYTLLMNSAGDSSFALGKVVFHHGNLSDIQNDFNKSYQKDLFYGSICTKTKHFHKVKGYNENFVKWGNDDDDIRKRLQSNSIKLVRNPNAKVLHYETKSTRPPRDFKQNLDIKFTNNDDWGKDF